MSKNESFLSRFLLPRRVNARCSYCVVRIASEEDEESGFFKILLTARGGGFIIIIGFG